MKLPKLVVVIVYGPETFAIECRRHVGEPYAKCVRTMFIYDENELQMRLKKAWKPAATAEVYSADYTKRTAYSAGKTKGVWS